MSRNELTEKKSIFMKLFDSEAPLCAAQVGVIGHHGDFFAGLAKPSSVSTNNVIRLNFPGLPCELVLALHMLL